MSDRKTFPAVPAAARLQAKLVNRRAREAVANKKDGEFFAVITSKGGASVEPVGQEGFRVDTVWMWSEAHDDVATEIADRINGTAGKKKLAYELWRETAAELFGRVAEGDTTCIRELLLADREACKWSKNGGRKELYEHEHHELQRKYIRYLDTSGHTKAIQLLAAGDDVSQQTIRRKLGFVGCRTKTQKSARIEQIRKDVQKHFGGATARI